MKLQTAIKLYTRGSGLFVVAISWAISLTPINAAPETYVGPSGGNWNHNANWTTTAPVNNDDLTFSTSASVGTIISNDNIGSLTSLNSINFTAQSNTLNETAGNIITLGPGSAVGSFSITNTAPGVQTINLVGLKLAGAGGATHWQTAVGSTTIVNSPLNLNGVSLSISGNGLTQLNGVVSGAGSAAHTGALIVGSSDGGGSTGNVTLTNNANTFTAGGATDSTSLLGGELTLDVTGATAGTPTGVLGTGSIGINETTGVVTVATGAEGINLANTVNVNATAFTVAPAANGSLTFSGPINLNTGAGTTVTITNSTNGSSGTTGVATLSGNVTQGAFVGTGLTFNGGHFVLSGLNTFSGGTTINTATQLDVGSAGALGTGFVTNNGILETTAAFNAVPARAINVTGAFTQTSNGTLLLQVVTNQGPVTTQAAAGVNYDTLAGASSAAVAGTLQLNFKSAPTQGERFQAVSSASSDVTGAFNAPATLSGAINPNYVAITTYNDSFGGTYAAHNAVVTLFEPFTAFPGLTHNQLSVATNVDNFVLGTYNNNRNLQATAGATDFFNNIVTGLSSASLYPGNLGHALDELSPQRYQILRNVAFDNYAFDVQGLDNYNADVRDGQFGVDTRGFAINDSTLGTELSQVKGRLLAWQPASEPGLLSDSPSLDLGGVQMTDPKDVKDMRQVAATQNWHAFVDGGVDLGDVDHNNDISHASYTTGKVRGGADYQVTQNLRVGGMFGYNHTDADLDNEGSSARVDSYTPGVYVAYADKSGFFANGLFNYTRNEYSTDRKIVIPGVNRSADGATGGNQFGGDLDGGYEFRTHGFVLAPSAGLTYVNLGIDSFNESDAQSASLSINSQSAESLRSRLGGSIRYEAKIGSMILRPHVSAFWQHEFLDKQALITSAFEGIPAGSFAVQTTKGDSDNALLGAGLDAEVARNVTLFVDYGAEAGGSTFFGQSATGGVKIGF
jgi:uncharacterized protein YhjY with autotransporter beta-barrel domain